MIAPANLQIPARTLTLFVPCPLPAELTVLPRFILWKKGSTKADGRFDKIPVHPDTGYACNDKDPAIWRPYADALDAVARLRAHGQQVDGIGIALGDGLAGVDLDLCRDPQTGVIVDWAQRIIARCASFTDVSPSDTGVKILLWGVLADKFVALMPDGGKVEVYPHKQFFTLTGEPVPGTPTSIADGQGVLDQLAAELATPVVATLRPLAASRSVAPVSDDLEALHMRAETLVAQMRAGGLERSAWQALKTELYQIVNPQIQAGLIARYNAETDTGNLLEFYGAQHDKRNGYSSPFEQHSHDVTYLVGDNNRGYSLSPYGRLSHGPGEYFDAFDVYCAGEGFSKREGLERLKARYLSSSTWPTRPTKSVEPPIETPTPQPSAADLTARKTDAQRKVDARRTEAAAIRASVEARAAQDDDLSERAQIALLALLDACGERACTRWSNARIVTHSGFSDGYIRPGLYELEGKDYFTVERRTNEAGEKVQGGSGRTVWRTLSPWHGYRPETPVATARATVYLVTESTHSDSSNGEGGGQAPAAPAPAPVVELEPVPIAIEGGASYDPATAVLVEAPYSCKNRRYVGDGQRSAWLADYYTLCAKPAPVELAPEPEQHQLADVKPAPRKKRASKPKPARFVTIAELELKILKATRFVANKARPSAQRRAVGYDIVRLKQQLVELQARVAAEQGTEGEAPPSLVTMLSIGNASTSPPAAQPPIAPVPLAFIGVEVRHAA